MNHKRVKPKNTRAGCLMCKPHKMNGAKRGRGLQPVGKTGGSNQKNEFLARIDVNEVEQPILYPALQ
ncbi:MAG: hypothetical protein NTAFB09_12700 [Nitrosospira sp.]